MASRKKRNNRTPSKADTEQRRAMVARLLADGLTVEEIHEAVCAELRPAALSTIYLDLEALRYRWVEEGNMATEERMQRQLSRIHALYTRALNRGDLKAEARAIELEIKLTGTASPDKLQIEHRGISVYLPDVGGEVE